MTQAVKTKIFYSYTCFLPPGFGLNRGNGDEDIDLLAVLALKLGRRNNSQKH